MELPEIKRLIEDCHTQGKTRLETVTFISTLPINGEASDAFEYIDIVYETAQAYNLTDLGNAERLIAQYGSNIRFCYDRNKWLIWKGTRWQWDDEGEILRLAQKVARTIYEEAAHEENDDYRKSIAKWAHTSESNQRINAMVAQAQPLRAIRLDHLDNNYWLLNCQNGTVNLRTGALQPHDKHDYMTLICPSEYDPELPHPVWDSFLNRICKDNQELIGYLQRCAGYSITGDTREQILFFIHGPGQNGKTTFLETLGELLGAYGTQANIEMFLSQFKPASAGHSEDVASLAGKRLVIASEIEDGRRLATAKLKQMTGGEKVRASHKYEREFEYQVTYKIWLNGNHKPDILDTTYSIWRRVKLILLDVVIPPEERDRKLREKLKAEYPSILAWVVQGCLDWQKIGLDDPLVVSNAVADYRHEQDVLAEFFSSKCFLNPADAECVVSHKELFTAYQVWGGENSIDPISSRLFSRRLKEKSGIQKIASHGQIKWRYIRLLKENEVEQRVDEVDKVDDLPKTLFHEENLAESPENPPTTTPSSTPRDWGSSTPSTIPETLPDCPECQQNEWVFLTTGEIQCPCGHILEV